MVKTQRQWVRQAPSIELEMLLNLKKQKRTEIGCCTGKLWPPKVLLCKLALDMVDLPRGPIKTFPRWTK